ncbi:MAG: 4-hydroxy-3-methylbut-2-enyl diphosphate reductase, partial [Brevundimonas sp.]|nr:4-hydroxy-3-methylbut-2-enyl diphosphate reductase [Brevundimonas sp.]
SVQTVGVTAGASAPEQLIADLVDAIGTRFATTVVEDDGVRESVTFKLPRALAD